jgi:tungstate transport system substrate-binding protein
MISKTPERFFIPPIDERRLLMREMKKWLFLAMVCLLGACATSGNPGGSRFILVSSTIGPIDAGVVDVLETSFEKETGIRVRHVGSGTGAALNLARKGQIDLVMVHAKALEEKFVAEGFGTERFDLMYNDFVIVGPPDDPAGIKGLKLAGDALKKIAGKGSLFISRGDNSGTHVAEMDLWKIAGIKPSGPWYQVFDKGSTGNVPTLQYTDEKSAYTVIDRATFLTLQKKIKLVVLVEGDEALLNFISLIPVSPQKFPKANYKDTMVFVKWLTAPEKGQKIIRDFGKDKYGSPLFFPNSKEWRQTQGGKS